MIMINNKKFAKNEKEFTDTLFQKDGTAFGYYKQYKNRIIFSDMQGKVFAALIKNKHGCHFVNAGVYDGKTRYQFAMSSQYEKLFGFPEKWSEQLEYIKALCNQHIEG